MLKQRAITAAVLLLVLALAIAAPNPWYMLGILAAMTVCAFWEWLRMAPVAPLVYWGASLLAGLALGYATILLAMVPEALRLPFYGWVLPLAAAFWLLAAPAMVYRAALPGFFGPWSLAILGLLLFAACWFALAWIFIEHGASALISLWALVWVADSAAYFVGRALGKHKLAPRVSPGKSIEGALAGLLFALIWMAACAQWWPASYGAILQQRSGWLVLVLCALFMAAWSVLGDLFESLLKRRAGVKDSSQLLPGHGGVYDRIDAILPVAVFGALLLA